MVPTNEYAGYFIQTTALKEEEKHSKVVMCSKRNRGTGRELLKLQEIAIAPQLRIDKARKAFFEK